MENIIKRAVIMADGPAITADDLGLSGAPEEEQPFNLRQVRDEAEYRAIVKALAQVEGNIVKASELLGVSRPTLYDLMERHAIKASAA
jgi:two-component system NtrC family response regulator